MNVNLSPQCNIKILLAASILVTGCAMQVKPEAKHVAIITQDQVLKCEFLKVINTYDVSLKYLGDGEAEGAQNQAKNRVAEIGGNAMRILSITNQEVKDKNKTYVTVEAYKCPANSSNQGKASDTRTNKQETKIEKSIEDRSNHETKPVPVQITIKEAQQKLAAIGYNPGPADGKTGGRTVAALKLFQKDKGLPITGRLDAETVARLVQLGSQ